MRTRCSHCQTDNHVLRVLGRPTGVHLRCRGCGRTIRVVESVGALFGIHLLFGVGYVVGFLACLEFAVPGFVAAFGPQAELLWYGLVPVLPAAALAFAGLALLARRSGEPVAADLRMSGPMFGLTYVTATFATIAIVALVVYTIVLGRYGTSLPEPPMPHDPAVVAAPDALASWDFVDPDGERRDLASLRDRPVFLHVFDVADPAARPVLQSIVRTGKKLAESGIVFVACAVTDAAELRAFETAPGAPRLPYVHADTPPPLDGEAAKAPTTLVLDARGRLVFRHHGIARWDTDAVRTFLRRVAGS